MNLRLKAAFLGALVTLVAGCACGPTGPLPPNETGRVNFVIRGPALAVSLFERKLDVEIPPNCKKRTPPEEIKARDGGPSDTTTLYQCVNTDETTFAVFGKKFTATIRGNADLGQASASLDPVIVAAAGPTALSMTATTSPCDYTYCKWLNSHGPWKQNMACQQYCN
jgi:hypothetical protein